MSIQAVAWALDHSQSRGVDRLVLIALANHANGETGQCWPSQRTIAREAGVATGTVSEALKRLTEIGEVEIVAPGDQRRSTRYRLPLTLSTGAQEMSAGCSPGERSVSV